MKKIPLTKGQFALVDDEDFDFLNQWSWCFHLGYAIRGHKNPSGKKRHLPMHRVINKTPLGKETDHINENKLDNQRSNLRTASHSQNKFNKGPQQNNTSGYKGVTFIKTRKKWQAQIQGNGKRPSLGYFDTAIEAAKAYDTASYKLHGEFGFRNFQETENRIPNSLT